MTKEVAVGKKKYGLTHIGQKAIAAAMVALVSCANV
jgi:hypothetical protein